MAVAAVFEFPKEAIEAYDRNLELHGETLRNQPARRFHVCFETERGYMVVDVWDSLEAFEAFGELLDDEVAVDFPFQAELKLHTIHKLL